MHYDGIVVGGGPAGISAALTLRRRNKTVALFTGGLEDIPLYKAKQIDNYPGCPRISGRELLETMERQARQEGVEIISGRVTALMPMEPGFGVAAGQDFYQCGALVLCTGIAPAGVFPGEKELLGRGVSYCVTCDGMLYRGKDVCLVGFTGQTEEEARLLEDMGLPGEGIHPAGEEIRRGGRRAVEALTVGGERYPCQGVFILRPGHHAGRPDGGLSHGRAHVAVGPGYVYQYPGGVCRWRLCRQAVSGRQGRRGGECGGNLRRPVPGDEGIGGRGV